MKNKTWAAWLAFAGGPLGLHRFYLFGIADKLGWLLWIPSALAFWGFQRVAALGVDDPVSWILFPVFGFAYSACCLNSIIYALMTPEQWNKRFNPGLTEDHATGQTNWLTIGSIVMSLLIGAIVLMSSIVYSFQRYFEVQIEQAHQISE
jgi:hypothetical protein